MAYLLALILPLTFFYSPKIEKSNIVMVTKPLTITQERNTPAYNLFQQSQIIQKNMQMTKQQQLREMASLNHVVQLSTETTEEITTVASVAEIKLDKAELHAEADRQIQALVNTQPQQSVTPSFTQMSEGAVIRGNFELKDGVGIVDHLVVLKRVFEGQSIEVGQVDLRAGQYQIAVGAFEGEIVAEVKDRTGILIGEDRQKIYNLKRAGTFFEGPTLRLGRPSAFALNGRSVDSRKINDKNLQASFFSGHYDLKKTSDVYPNVARHSSTLSFIKDTTNTVASTLSVRSAADSSDTVLFSRKWVEGAVDYLSEQLQIQYMPETGIIIGRILVDGKPVQGAQVMVENQPGLEPYYLDQFLIPQQSQNYSSENGYFIIPGLNEGVYEITAYMGDRRLGTQQFLVAADTVSYQEIYSSAIPTSVIARSFDAFTSEPIMTELMVPGQADILNLESDLIRYRHNSQFGLTEIVNRPLIRDYAAYIYIQSLSKDHLHLPQIKEAFLEYVTAQAQIQIEPETSTFVGFTPNNFFDVHVADENYNSAHVVYFDQTGNIAKLNPGTLVVSPGVPLKGEHIQKLKALNWQITSEITLACQFLTDEKLIGITGSVAKSTVTSLVGAALKVEDPNAFVGGNLGVPFCEYALGLLQGKSKARYGVLELSSYQLENCKDLKLEASAITFLSANHLERYSSVDEYYMTKCHIGDMTNKICVLNAASSEISKYSYFLTVYEK